MKGLSIEIYDDDDFEPQYQHHDFENNDDSEVESGLSELDDDEFWEALANIK